MDKGECSTPQAVYGKPQEHLHKLDLTDLNTIGCKKKKKIQIQHPKSSFLPGNLSCVLYDVIKYTCTVGFFFPLSFSKARDGLLISNLIPMPKFNFDYLVINIMGTWVSQPKRKCDHIYARMRSHKVNQGPWYIGVRLASDHTAFLTFLPVIIPAGLIQVYVFYRRTGRMVADHPRILFLLSTQSRAHLKQTRTITVCERVTQAPPFTPP